MLLFLKANGGTIAVGLAVAALLFAVARKLILDRRQGKSSCGCNCANCPSAGRCHAPARSQGAEKPAR